MSIAGLTVEQRLPNGWAHVVSSRDHDSELSQTEISAYMQRGETGKYTPRQEHNKQQSYLWLSANSIPAVPQEKLGEMAEGKTERMRGYKHTLFIFSRPPPCAP
jgi:hypothetical protein